jgi:hypothetical protein
MTSLSSGMMIGFTGEPRDSLMAVLHESNELALAAGGIGEGIRARASSGSITTLEGRCMLAGLEDVRGDVGVWLYR